MIDGIPIGSEVEVYRNIRKGTYSIRHPKTKRVIGHANTISLKDVTFKVSEAGRQRVLRDKRKNVHAIVRGTLLGLWDSPDPICIGDLVKYNPYKNDSFVTEHSGYRVFAASIVVLTGKGAIVQKW